MGAVEGLEGEGYGELDTSFSRALLENDDGGTPVTCPTDPLGGHFSTGTSKTPPRPAREGGRIVIYFRLCRLLVEGSEGVAGGGESRCPIANGLPVTVAGARTRFQIRDGHIFRHWDDKPT